MLETDVQASPETPAEPESQSWTWLIVAAVLALVVGSAIGWWLGSDGEESVETPDVVERWAEAWVSGDYEGLDALYAQDAVFVTPTDQWSRGVIRAAALETMANTDFSALEREATIVGDDVIVVEYTVRGTHDYTVRGTDVRPGVPVETQLVAVFEVDADGLLARSTVYFDESEMFPDG